MLLFIDQQHDLHADWVEAECDRRTIPYLRLCTETFPAQTQLAIQIEEGEIKGTIRSSVSEIVREIPIEEITGIWHRRPADITLHPEMDPDYRQFAWLEANETLDGLYRVLWDRRWISPPHCIDAANHKIHQLRLARKLGFQTVPTLVTNDPDQAKQFFHYCGGAMIYKALRQVAIAHIADNAYGLYTTRISQENLEQHLDSIRYIPCLFQQWVPKQHELRVNVIGDQLWTAAIYSQEAEHTQLDFRPYTEQCRHAPSLLPPKLEARCLELNRQLGLRMSNIDLIVTPAGEYIFLEINPNGQWAWIEDVVGFPLATALVDELMGVDTLTEHPYRKHRSLHFTPNTAIKNLTG